MNKRLSTIRRPLALAALGILSLLPAGCRWGASLPPATLAEARAAYAAGNYDEAHRTFARIHDHNATSEPEQEAMLGDALALEAMGDRGAARELYATVRQHATAPELWAESRMGLGRVADPALADAAFDELLQASTCIYPRAEILAAWIQRREQDGNTAGASALRSRTPTAAPVADTPRARYVILLKRGFATQHAADAEAARLRRAGLDTWVRKKNNTYRIQLASFTDATRARQRADALAQYGQPLELIREHR